MNALMVAAAIGSAALAGYALGVAAGHRQAWRIARAYLAEHGRLPIAPTLYERQRRDHPSNPQRRRGDRGTTDLGYTVAGVALLALVLCAGWIVETLAAALEALVR